MKIIGSQFHRRSIAAAHAEAEELRNRYEAAIVCSPHRPYQFGFTQDQRFDATQADRMEMSRKIRDFVRNMWLPGAIAKEFGKWTVGPNGLQVIPETSNDEWDELMLADFLLWCNRPCYDSTITMSQVHKQIAHEFSVEGGLFWLETFRRTASGPSEPAIQLIRGHSVGSPSIGYFSSDDVIDGVQIGTDSNGNPTLPIGYWTKDGTAPDGWSFRSTSEMHHIWDPTIPNSYRELTPYHPVIDTMADLKQLEEWEIQRAKANAEDAKVFTTTSGQVPAAVAIRSAFARSNGEAAPAVDDVESRMAVYRKILGPRSIALRPGEDVKTPVNASPSAAQQWLWRKLIGQVCLSNGVYLTLLFPELLDGTQGTLIRGIYDSMHEFFRSVTSIFVPHVVRMYLFYADWARRNRPQLFRNAPEDWYKCRVILPRAVNVDIGYTADAQLAKLDAGLTDWDTEAAATGTTSEEIARRKARQIIKFRRIADEESKRSGGYFVKPEEIAGSLADIREKLAAAVSAGKPKQPAV